MVDSQFQVLNHLNVFCLDRQYMMLDIHLLLTRKDVLLNNHNYKDITVRSISRIGHKLASFVRINLRIDG